MPPIPNIKKTMILEPEKDKIQSMPCVFCYFAFWFFFNL